MERQFKRDLDALDDVFAFIDGFIEAEPNGSSLSFPLRLAVEELFVNMVRHNPEGSSAISLCLDRDADRIVTTLVDFDSEPFDITTHKTVSTDAPLEERPIGGLGIFLAKRMMDEVYYEYRDRRTCIRLIKNLGPDKNLVS